MLDLHPKPFNKACYADWQDGDSTDNGKPQGNQPFGQAMQGPQGQRHRHEAHAGP